MTDVARAPVSLAEHLHQQSVKARVFGRTVDARLDRYVVLGKLGEGGTGAVFVAHDPTLDRKVAIKLLCDVGPGTARGEGDEGTLRWYEALEQEARAMARLSHPHVVQVYEVGEREGQRYLVMELVHGTTLRAWQAQARERLGPRRAIREITTRYVQAGRGLAAAHRVGLVHRDFKPDNVLVDEEGCAKVCDFGLARVFGAEVMQTLPDGLVHRLGRAEGSSTPPRTAMMGTPAYMAPEQLRGEGATERSDQFAFCVALYEALEGERPFEGSTLMEGKRRVPSRPSAVPSWLRRVCERGLALEPGQRWPSMDALLDALTTGRTRARVRRGLVVVGVLAALGVGVHGYRRYDIAQRVASCEASGDELDVAWNPARRQALHDALVATGASHAATTADKVMPWLEQQAGEWREARVGACLDVQVRGQWDATQLERSLWCLDERRTELQSLVDELTQADAAVLSKAVPAAAALASVAPCRDPSALVLMTPPSPEDREAVRAVRAEVIRAGNLERAGRYPAGLALARRALERAEALHWPPLVAAARSSVGRLLARTGAHAEAEAALEDAYFEAAHGVAPQTVVDAATALVFVVGYQLARPIEGRRWGRLADVALTVLPDAEGPRRAMLLEHQASLHMAAEAYDEAVALYERSLALFERTLGATHPTVAQSLGHLAGALRSRGHYDDAKAALERALVITRQTLGPEHPGVAIILQNFANLHQDLGDHTEALALYEQSLSIYEQVLGPTHVTVAHGLINIANIHYLGGANDEALAGYGRALRILEQELGADHPDVGRALGNLANVHLAQGDHGQAQALQQRALAIKEKALGPEHPAVARSLGNLANVHEAAGAHDEASALHERALAILEKSMGPEHPDVAQALYNLATVRYASQAYDEAGVLHERALAILEKSVGPEHPDVSGSLLALAEVALAQGRPSDAVRLARRAVAVGERAGMADERLTEARSVLAKAQAQRLEEGGLDRVDQ